MEPKGGALNAGEGSLGTEMRLAGWFRQRGGPWVRANAGLHVDKSVCHVRYFTLRNGCVGFCFRILEASPREGPTEVSSKRTLFLNNKTKYTKGSIRVSKLVNY